MLKELLKVLYAEILPLIGESAPTLATIITGSPIPGEAIKLIAGAFGADQHNPKTIIAQLLSHPDAKGILAKLESDHGGMLQQLMMAAASGTRPSKIAFSCDIQWADTCSTCNPS